VYLLFGSAKDITIGPTAILSILTYPIAAKYNADFVVLLSFLSGCVIFLSSLFGLGFLTQFISAPTITAFFNAALLTIGSGQLKRLSGIRSGSGELLSFKLSQLICHF